MTTAEITRLLAVAAAFDHRTVGEVEILAWTQALHDVELAVAERCVVAFYRRFAPADRRVSVAEIRDAWRAHRHRAEDDQPATRAVVDAHGWPVGDDPHHGRRNSPELQAIHTAANLAPCTACGATASQRCRNATTRNTAKIPHHTRLAAARKAGRL